MEGYLPAAVGVLEDQQAFNGSRNQAATEVYPEDQQVGTGDPINLEGLEPQLDSLAETLLRVPKTPDTSFESKSRSVTSGAEAARANVWSESGELH